MLKIYQVFCSYEKFEFVAATDLNYTYKAHEDFFSYPLIDVQEQTNLRMLCIFFSAVIG